LVYFSVLFSPRWVFSKKGEKETKDMLRRIRYATEDQINRESNDIERELVDLEVKGIDSYRHLFRRPMLHPFLFGVAIQVLQQLTGINSIIYYAPQILKQAVYNNQMSPFLATGINGCVNVIATIPTIIFIDNLFFGSVL
jgi:hypothetical protein